MRNVSNMKIFYHGSDCDGLASGALFKIKYPRAEMYPVDYGQPFPVDEINLADVVAIVDFCPDDFDIIEKIIEKASILWLIDHHATTREKADKHNLKNRLKKPSEFVTDSDEEKYAACELTYMWMHNTTKVPYYLKLLGRYDVWDHSDPNTLPFQYAARAWLDDPRKDLQKWKKLIYMPRSTDEKYMQGLIDKGKLIMEYVRKENKKFAQNECFELEFNGYKALAVNRPYTGPHFFDLVYDSKKHDILISFGFAQDTWKFSLYSERVDVGSIAKKYGGGGHRLACGWSSNELPKEIEEALWTQLQ